MGTDVTDEDLAELFLDDELDDLMFGELLDLIFLASLTLDNNIWTMYIVHYDVCTYSRVLNNRGLGINV